MIGWGHQYPARIAKTLCLCVFLSKLLQLGAGLRRHVATVVVHHPQHKRAGQSQVWIWTHPYLSHVINKLRIKTKHIYQLLCCGEMIQSFLPQNVGLDMARMLGITGCRFSSLLHATIFMTTQFEFCSIEWIYSPRRAPAMYCFVQCPRNQVSEIQYIAMHNSCKIHHQLPATISTFPLWYLRPWYVGRSA